MQQEIKKSKSEINKLKKQIKKMKKGKVPKTGAGNRVTSPRRPANNSPDLLDKFFGNY
jgi:hypothetical protein